jgi:hypothetical protein
LNEDFNPNQENNHNNTDNNNPVDYNGNDLQNDVNNRLGDDMNSSQKNDADNIKKMTMDNNGHIQANKNGAAVMTKNSTLFTVLGWVSAALSAFISPLFAIAGIIFGVLLNKQAKGKGNPIIIVNIFLAAINIVFGIFLLRMMPRY